MGVYSNELGVVGPRGWASAERNFDNVGEAYFTLFEVASLDAWTDVMYRSMDVVGEDQQPRTDASW